MTSGGPSRRRWIADLSATVLLLGVAVIGFQPTFGGPAYLVPALGGLVLGVAVAVLGARLRWGILTIAAVTVGSYFVFGSALAVPRDAVAGVIPTLDSLRQLAAGVVTSWKQLVTTPAPVAVADGFGLVPFLMLLTGGVLTASLALRLRGPWWALLPAAAVLCGQIALGTATPAAPLVQGVLFAVVAVAWIALRQAWAPAPTAVSLGQTGRPTRAGSRRRVLTGAGIVAVAILAGVATSAFGAPAGPRYVVRDVVIPPFEIQQYPSPLQSFRGLVRDDRETTLFTVHGLPANARVRLAAMDAYSGAVYNVADAGFGSSSAFSPVRAGMSAGAQGATARVRVEIGALDGVWLPDVGAVQSIAFEGARADALRRSAGYNDVTSTGVVGAGLTAGDAYELATVIAPRPTDTALEKASVAPLKVPRQRGVPQDFAGIAATITAGAKTPVEQVRLLQKHFAEGGFFSHGLAGEVWSLPGHGAARISALLQAAQPVGDDEQYATAMALLAGQLGIPARVVMGFYPADRAHDTVFAATGDDLHAWVEVPFTGYGWVAFDPTPPKDHVPSQQTTKPRTEPKPQVLQPPPPDPPQAAEAPSVPADHGPKDEHSGAAGLLLAILAATGIGAGVVGVFASPFILIGALKTRRRRRRRQAARPADRVSGGWDELVDRAVDLGATVPSGATRREDAAALGAAFAEPGVGVLARTADARVWGPGDPTDDEIAAFWDGVDEAVEGMGRERGRAGRLVARISLRSLVAGTAAERWMPRVRLRAPEGADDRDAAAPPAPQEGPA